jgi:hypothetical protein
VIRESAILTALALSFTLPAQADTISKGTMIEMRPIESFALSDPVGRRIKFVITHDLMTDQGALVVRKGTHVDGFLTKTSSAHEKDGSVLAVEVNEVPAINGQPIPVKGEWTWRGQQGQGAAIGVASVLVTGSPFAAGCAQGQNKSFRHWRLVDHLQKWKAVISETIELDPMPVAVVEGKKIQ